MASCLRRDEGSSGRQKTGTQKHTMIYTYPIFRVLSRPVFIQTPKQKKQKKTRKKKQTKNNLLPSHPHTLTPSPPPLLSPSFSSPIHGSKRSEPKSSEKKTEGSIFTSTKTTAGRFSEGKKRKEKGKEKEKWWEPLFFFFEGGGGVFLGLDFYSGRLVGFLVGF